MIGYFYCALAIFTIPSVLAISCYRCISGENPGQTCVSGDINITNCDTAPELAPGVKFDACLKVAYQFTMGDVKIPMNTMICAVKAMCGMAKAQYCNASNFQGSGMTMKSCEANCCFQDKCNGLNATFGTISPTVSATMPASIAATTSGKGATTTGPTITSNACLHVASFTVIFMSITVMFAGFFMH
ncbi:uncharacterized protein LOC144648972 [Oculina patagonica]